MLKKIFEVNSYKNDNKIKYRSIVNQKINNLNANRGFHVLILASILELILICLYDIPNVLINGWFKEYAIHYLIVHSTLFLVSLFGSYTSYMYIYTKESKLFKYISFDSLVWIFSLFFLSGIAFVNGLDQIKTDNIAIYIVFILVISLFIVMKPKYIIVLLGLSYIVFIISHVTFQKDNQILVINITNATMLTILSMFLSIITYRNFIDFSITSIKLEETSKQLEVLSVTDQLTNIFNRRKFEENIVEEIARSKRNDVPFCLLIFDIDYFKNVNDTYGHTVGDEILINLANYIKQRIRYEDTFARFGGEEFILILSNTNLENAVAKAEQIRKNIKNEEFSKDISVTISIGVTEFNKNDTRQSIVSRTDKALYEAKGNGRDKVVSIIK